MSPELIVWLASLSFILGIIAFVLEIFVFTGFGVAGVIGIILMGWGILLLAVDITQVTSALVIALITTIVLILAGIKLGSRYKMWYRFTLQNRQRNEEGYIAPASGLALFVGKEGIALTPLRPSGAAEIDGQRVDVVTEGEFVAVGAGVKVVKVEGTRVIVKEI